MTDKPKSVAEFMARARAAGHDAFGIANDPEAPKMITFECMSCGHVEKRWACTHEDGRPIYRQGCWECSDGIYDMKPRD